MQVTCVGPNPKSEPLSGERLGLDPEHEVIPYCQGGYRSANAYIALRMAGYPRVRNYLGSWAEWGNREDLPIDHPQRTPR